MKTTHLPWEPSKNDLLDFLSNEKLLVKNTNNGGYQNINNGGSPRLDVLTNDVRSPRLGVLTNRKMVYEIAIFTQLLSPETGNKIFV